MKCTHPIYALDLGINSDTGKRLIKILPKRSDRSSYIDLENFYGKGNIIPLPCGHCLACRVNYTSDWSVRCMLEASLYKFNYFVTLTYDDEHLKHYCRKDFKSFLDRLSYYIPGVRFFACFEKGETTHRPHFHAILFNCNIPDLKYLGSRNGFAIYDSPLLKKTWRCGLIDIQDVSLATCQYVAGYVMKKLRVKDPEEYVLMSTHPGIGAGYFDKHYQSIYETDGVYVKGSKHTVPRYFDKLLERLNPDMFRSIKYERIKDVSFIRIDSLLRNSLEFDELVYEKENKSNIARYKDHLKLRSAV